MLENWRILPQVQELFNEMVEIRRDIHRHPELLFNLPRTSSKVANYLKTLDLQVIENVGQSGVVGILQGEGPCILLRADMDALPVQELNDVEYKSTVDGVSHACGHDAHTAMLMIAAKILKQIELSSGLKGSVKFMFQPAEEGGFGALEMINDKNHPILEAAPKVDQAYAIHVSGVHELGEFDIAEYMTASNDGIVIEVIGTGGHMSAQTNNPVTIAADIILTLQSIISRNIDNSERLVLSITSINAGEVVNAVPDKCIVKGSIRSLKEKVRQQTILRVQEICKGAEIKHGCKINLQIRAGYPSTINHPSGITNFMKAIKATCPEAVIDTRTHMASEDFSYLLQSRPGAFLVVGTQGGAKEANHSGKFDIDERGLLVGASILVRLVLDLIGA